MRQLQYGLLSAIGVMALVGCGDDVTKVYEESGIASVESLKDLECNDDSEGEFVFSKKDKEMFTCEEGKWVSVVGESSQSLSCETKELKDKSGVGIYCNGDSIGVVLNGKVGATGKAGADGKNGVDGKDGEDGKNGADGEDGEDGKDGSNGKDGKAGAAGTSCVIESATADSVFIACGDEVAAIALPGAGAENYTRPVSLALPFIYEGNIGFAPKADVRVMALDDKLSPNGLVFSTEIAGAASKSGNSNQGRSLDFKNGGYVNMEVLFLTGEIKASVKNPYVLVRVDFDISRYEGNGPGYTYYALADMRDTSALKVSFMSDFKVQRVQKLVADGETIENAMEQADKELYKAFGLDYMGPVEALMDNALDNYDLGWVLWTSEDVKDASSSMGWYKFDMTEFFSRVKSQFALDGDFNTPVTMEKGNIDNEYVKFDVLMVDMYFGLLSEYGNVESISRMLEEEYGLESCLNITKDTVAIPKARGMLSVDFVFECGAHDAYWKLSEKEFGDKEILAMVGECSEENEWEVNEAYFSKRCEKNADGEYAWVIGYDRNPESVLGFCQPEDEDIVKYFASSSSYYVCQDHQWEELNENQYIDGVICDGKTKKDSVYILDGWFAMCEVSVNGKDSIYAWSLLDETVENIDRLGKQLLGACTEDLYDTVKTVSLGYYDMNLVCDGEKWVYSDIPLGVCDENKVNTLSSKIPTNSKGVVENVEVYKCINNGSQEEPEYRWVSADEIDRNVGFPCTNVKEGFEKDSPIYDFNGESYMCNISTGNWNVLGADRCDQILNPSTGKAYKAGDSFEPEDGLIYACDEDGNWNAIYVPEEE